MGPLALLCCLFIMSWPVLVAASTLSMAKLGCSDKCGNITVPYPFGFGADESCHRSLFRLTCNYDYNPPKLFDGDVEVLGISLQGQMRIMSYVSQDCYNPLGRISGNSPSLDLKDNPRTFSDTENKFTVLGCDTRAFITGSKGRNFTSGCNMICRDINDPIEGSCSGVGCCQTSIPKGFKFFQIGIGSFYNHTEVLEFNPCSYAFLVDISWYNFYVSNLSHFSNNVNQEGYSQVPIVLDWAIEQKNSPSCEEAREDSTTYACGNNSDCYKSKNGLGYSCNCSQGYQGNPYLPDGCQDINECADPVNSPCNRTCINLPGSYSCSCPPNYLGDGKKNGTGCSPPPKPYNAAQVIQVTIGVGLAFLFLLIGTLLVLSALQKRKDNKLKQKFFEQNGGLMLEQQLSSHGGTGQIVKIFTADELKQATNNYAQSQILGRGGYGTVYKGILQDRTIVAIKKSKVVDKSQIKPFMNELLILSQINHKNVVKLLGFCLETEVPTLVYEFVTNNTLFYHIHGEGCNYPISWDNRLRIAVETSEVLAYLHSSTSQPIIHRDIKSANILLDDNYMAKVADFGVSMLVLSNQTQINTLVQGTLGYLDPEYLQSSQLTEKSDVYSFGVVLAELLTGKKALYSDGTGKKNILAMYFVTSIKEGRVWDILDNRIITEECKKQLHEVIQLTEKCLRVNGEERPTMKEVAIELEGLMRYQKHPRIAHKAEEVKCLLGEPSDMNSDKTNNTTGYYSLTNQVIASLDGGR